MTSDLETKAGPYVNGPTLVRQYPPTEHSRDDAALARLGKKAVLKRNFGFLTIMGFSCTVLVTWEGCLMYESPLLPIPSPHSTQLALAANCYTEHS